MAPAAGPARRRVIQEFLVVALVLTTLLGAGMLLSDMKGIKFRLPSLATLKKLLPESDEEDDADDDSTFVTYAEERTPVHHDLLPSERAPAAVFVASAPPPPAVQMVSLEQEADPELPPGTYDVHQPNLNRTDLEEPDPEIDAVVASLAEEAAIMTDEQPLIPSEAPQVEPEPEPAAGGGGGADDLMSFFEDVQAVSKVPSTLTEGLPKVTASELLTEAQELRQMLTGRKDTAA